MSAYVIAEIEITDPTAYEEYPCLNFRRWSRP